MGAIQKRESIITVGKMTGFKDEGFIHKKFIEGRTRNEQTNNFLSGIFDTQKEVNIILKNLQEKRDNNKGLFEQKRIKGRDFYYAAFNELKKIGFSFCECGQLLHTVKKYKT